MESNSESSAGDSAKENIATLSRKAGIDESIRTYKLLEALRSGSRAALDSLLGQGDTGSAFDALDDHASTNSNPSLDQLSPLLLAVQVASTDTIAYLLGKGLFDLDAKDPTDGSTALHIAAKLGRTDVALLLLDQPSVNENATDKDGRVALQVARSAELETKLKDAIARKVEEANDRFAKVLMTRNYDALDTMFDDQSVSARIDLNKPVSESGSTYLHDAVRNKDTTLIKWLLLHGADPFRRDKVGKNAIDVTKDDGVRAMLKKSQQGALVGGTTSSPTEPIKMSGYLKKWTNYKSGYKMRWVVLEDGVLSYFKHQDDTKTACRGSINLEYSSLHYDTSNKSTFDVIGRGSVKYALKASHPVEAQRWVWALTAAIRQEKDKTRQQQKLASPTSPTSGSNFPPAKPDVTGLGRSPSVASNASKQSRQTHNRQSSLQMPIADTASRKSITDDEESLYGEDDPAATEENLERLNTEGNAVRLQLSCSLELCDSLVAETTTSGSNDPALLEVAHLLRESVRNLQSSYLDLMKTSADRDKFWSRKLDKETKLRRLWEESMQNLAKEQEELQAAMLQAHTDRKKAKRALREANARLHESGAPASQELSKPGTQESQDSSESAEKDSGAHRVSRAGSAAAAAIGGAVTTAFGHKAQDSTIDSDDDDDDDDDDEEFYDAVGSGEVKVKQVSSQDNINDPEWTERMKQIDTSFKGYEDPVRTKLDVIDNRPKLSLWSILKSMIGKDMTRMSLPVTFNEPTSLLQRAAEDMEYADILNYTVRCEDPCERMMYVAAFAASEYSSTTNRIAKPFNPLLGETFEYCRPDMGYRYIIEQVSHHPPIGAAYSESPSWQYYGESSVDSKFYGKSFDINPLGTWFLSLRPHSGSEELYTWRKVTSSVVGIITGSPTVDNYGKMAIVNHSLGVKCDLDFKQRGWRSSGAYEVKGTVIDRTGTPRWHIVGHWNDKIYGRKIGADGKEDASSAILLWQKHDRPPAPFNLTQFVISLNALPKSLQPWLPPTDTRLRPDQRAMEEGRYDDAAKEKNRLEERQRAKRREREAKNIKYEPRWFHKSMHPVTREPYWQFDSKYWAVRDEMGSANGDKHSWPNVDTIFE